MFFKGKCDFKIVNPDKLEGKIFIGHETNIVFIRLDCYKEPFKRILPIKFGYGKRI